jgi:hypothetical protein
MLTPHPSVVRPDGSLASPSGRFGPKLDIVTGLVRRGRGSKGAFPDLIHRAATLDRSGGRPMYKVAQRLDAVICEVAALVWLVKAVGR